MFPMNKAEIKVITVDIQSHLKQKKIDAAAVNALIDKKYDLKKAGSKTLVDAYAQLKTVFTDPQQEKAKEIWLEKSRKGCQKRG
jgi:Spy/CpxP family protein refolding chaperone